MYHPVGLLSVALTILIAAVVALFSQKFEAVLRVARGEPHTVSC